MFQVFSELKIPHCTFSCGHWKEVVQLLECTRVLPMGVTPEGLQNGSLGCGLAFPLPEKSDLIRRDLDDFPCKGSPATKGWLS